MMALAKEIKQLTPDVVVNKRFGAQMYQTIKERLALVGREEGIAFGFESRTGDTRDSHRLIQLGKAKGGDAQDRVVARLFRLYFEEDGDITSRDALAAAAADAGLDRAEAADWLDAGRGGAEVDAEVEEAYARGIHGVPHFTINGRYEVEGAQDPQVFLEHFAKIKAGQREPQEASGPACTPGGVQC